MGWQQYEALAEGDMSGWAMVLFVVALIAAVFGFSGLAAGVAPLVQTLFFVCLILFLTTLIARVRSRESGDV